ncbi:MAG TPA: DUF2892 domain-containing protein [Polyangiales bacterium]
MSVESIVRALAGTIVLLSLVLYLSIGPWALLLTTFVGLNLVQSAFTGFCPAERIVNALRASKSSLPKEGTP